MLDRDFKRLLENYNFSHQNYKNEFNSIIWKKINDEKKFNLVDLDKIKNFRNNGLSRGFDNDYLKINNLEHKKNFLNYLNKLEIKFNDIKKILPEKNIGNNPTAINYDGIYLDSKSKDFLNKYSLINKYIFKKQEIYSCSEIGGGYGELARMIIKTKKIKYIMIDLPETNLISSYYLKSYFPDKKFVLSIDLPKGELTKNLYHENDIFIICPWDKLGDFKVDIFLNFHSFMEMNIKTRKKYFNLIHSKIEANGFFLTENRYCQLVKLEKNLLKDYEYDNKWKKIIYKQSQELKRMGIILTQRISSNSNEIILMKKQIEKDSKEFEVPNNLPVVLILIYRFFKNLFKKNE